MLDAQRLLDAARTRAGLEEYGDLGFTEGLGVLVGSINADAGLDAEREARIHDEIVRVLVNRLRMQRDITAHPEILEEPLLPPVFITSIPRTGSTKLHRLLAATGDFNALTYWMTHNFAPFPDAAADGPDPRIEAARRYLEWEHGIAPAYQAAHPHYHDEFEEELALLDAGFNSLYTWAAFLDVQTYVAWVLGGDGLQAFRDLRQLLQYIQWQHYRGRGRRWVLKTPSLFGFEGAYAAVLPGTDFIVTHRDPVDVWPSVCTLFCGVRGVYNDTDFRATASDFMIGTFGQAQHAHLQWRDAYPQDKVLDVRFDEVMGDESALLRRIYAWLGMTYSDAAEDNLQAWIERDAARGHVRTAARLEDYGATAEGIRSALAPYIARYGEHLTTTERI